MNQAMQVKRRGIRWVGMVFLVLILFGLSPAQAFVPLKGDLSKYDPNNQTFPTSGDTIRVAIWDSFTGPNAYIGEAYYAILGFVAQDINSQGGIKVDGKMKKIQIVKVDTQSSPDVARRALEKAILQDKIHAFTGVAGTHIAKIGQALAKEYKVIFVNVSAYSDELSELPNFNEYFFRTCGTSSTSAKSLGVFYKNRPETKFISWPRTMSGGMSPPASLKRRSKKSNPMPRSSAKNTFLCLPKTSPPIWRRFGPPVPKWSSPWPGARTTKT